jgi:hypothetical protein
MANRGRRAGARKESLGLDELMIVNPHGGRGGAGMLLGADGEVYDVRLGAADDRYYLGDDGSLYENARARSAATPPRYLLGGDGALYAVEWTKHGSGALGCTCGTRTACACAAWRGAVCMGGPTRASIR